MAQVPAQMNSRERMQEMKRQTSWFQALVKADKLDEAERALIILSSSQVGLWPASMKEAEVAGMHSTISLRRGDYTSALADLKLYFEGSPEHHRTVGGATDLRIWYWFLLTQRGELDKARRVLGDLFRSSVHSPGGSDNFDPTTTSRSSLAQVYMYMAARKAAANCLYRSDQYLKLAKRADPTVRIDPNFEKYLLRFGYVKGKPDPHESDELTPALDHTVFEKQQGRPLRIF